MINACIIGGSVTTAQSDVKEEIVDAAVTTRKERIYDVTQNEMCIGGMFVFHLVKEIMKWRRQRR